MSLILDGKLCDRETETLTASVRVSVSQFTTPDQTWEQQQLRVGSTLFKNSNIPIIGLVARCSLLIG